MRFWIPQMIRGMNEGAFRGSLSCPVCQSLAIRFIEKLGQYRSRYRCRKCGLPFQYDYSQNPLAHPYAPLKKPKFQKIVQEYEASKGEPKKT